MGQNEYDANTREIIAPLVIDGPINGELLVAYLRQQLIPAMRAGDTLVLDNLSAHKSVAVANALQEARMQVLFLPPYSPEWNPIELTFNVFKGRMRTAKERTVEGLHHRCGEESEKFTPQQCKNFILKCGYRYSYVKCVLRFSRIAVWIDRTHLFRCHSLLDGTEHWLLII